MGRRSLAVRSFAKINLHLRVLHKRADGFHELRTVFHTVSLADRIHIDFQRARRTELRIDGNVDIPNNLVLRAAEAVLQTMGITARLSFRLDKRIPVGAGLGGGSSNAAAVLLSVPVLAGVAVPLEKLVELGTELGSDVPFFLYGGAALGIGRGTELFPLPELPAYPGILIAPGVHVATADAYRDLNRGAETAPLPPRKVALTRAARDSDTDTFRLLVWSLSEKLPEGGWKSFCENDFEGAVFRRHPILQSIKRKLATLGARPALMSGSGSALYGFFDSGARANEALLSLARNRGDAWEIFRITLLSRRRYRSAWRRQLGAHANNEVVWPPRSKYSKR